MARRLIDYVEKNVHGAWVICGAIGIRQYYYYTKKQAVEMYRTECARTLVENRRA